MSCKLFSVTPGLLSGVFLAGVSGPSLAADVDPWEPFNRQIYRFNDGLDRHLVKPVAQAYADSLPAPVRRGVNNFFSNLDDVVVIVNDVLQLKGHQTMMDITRFLANTSFGVLGIFDVASHWELPKHNEDFGQTLGRWGVGAGPYLVLPFLGPSSVRDTVGRVGDYPVYPVTAVDSSGVRYTGVALDAVDTRANLLSASNILAEAALDPYVFVRDSYLQRRQSLVYDGHPPREDWEDNGSEDVLP